VGRHRLAYGLFIGAALANTANPVLARILYDLGLLDRPIGVVTMTATIIDDLLAWSVLGFVLGQFDSPQTAVHGGTPAWLTLGFFACVLLAGRFVFAPLLEAAGDRLAWPTGFLSIVTVLVLLCGAASDYLGLHAFLGPFLLGLALAPSIEQKHEAYAVIHHVALSFFVPVYFVSIALEVNFAARFDLLLVVTVLVAASLSKVLSVFGAARASGADRRTAWAIACGMNARGATGIILASVGLEHGVIDERVYVALVVMALVTSLVAGPAMKRLAPPVGPPPPEAVPPSGETAPPLP
jgi:Kef-type K+ transport system membrane component KefB